MPTNIVLREYRDLLIAILNRFLDGQQTSDDYEWLHILSGDLEDETVQLIADHLTDILGTERTPDAPPITKQTWDYLQRLMLILHSDAHVNYVPGIWSITQLGALLALLAYASFAVINGQVYDPRIAIAFSIPALTLTLLRLPYAKSKRTPFQEIIYPFPSITLLSTVYRSTSTFRKRRFPSMKNTPQAEASSSGNARSKSILQHFISCLKHVAKKFQTYLAYLCILVAFALFSPLVLLCLLFPIQKDEVVVSIPE